MASTSSWVAMQGCMPKCIMAPRAAAVDPVGHRCAARAGNIAQGRRRNHAHDARPQSTSTGTLRVAAAQHRCQRLRHAKERSPLKVPPPSLTARPPATGTNGRA
eukprot:8541399-Lingulodinium_polyedra.AAC.1